ncbi:MAG: hypothetical protein V4580_06555 [Bacteroidota bacterium]
MINFNKITGFLFKVCVLLLMTMQFSCGIFWVRNHDPKARFCSLDLKTGALNCDPPNGGGISKVLVFLHSDVKGNSILLDKRYPTPVNKIDLSETLKSVDPSLLKDQEIHIQIWNNSPVMFDYGIDVKPKDQAEKKVVTGWWNAR